MGTVTNLQGWQRPSTAVAWAIMALIAVGFVYLRLNLSGHAINGDEEIVLNLSSAMDRLGRLDPNWALTDLRDSLRYNQYNFYSYNLLSHFVIKAGSAFGFGPLTALRMFNILYQAIAIIAAGAALRNLGAPGATIALSAVLLTIAPALVQDAHIARAESFHYMLLGLVWWVSTLPASPLKRCLFAGLLIGVGVATKITFVFTALLLIPDLVALLRRDLKGGVTASILLGLGMLVGFAASAPYAVLNWDVYLHGINRLQRQYSTGHGPHSLPTFSFARQVGWIAAFLFVLYGVGILAPLVSPAMRGLPRPILGLWLYAMGMLAYFATRAVFFERNISLAIFGALILLAWIVTLKLRRHSAALLLLMSAVPMVFWSWHIAYLSKAPSLRRHTWELSNNLSGSQRFWRTVRRMPPAGPACMGHLAVPHYNDEHSDILHKHMEATGYTPVARYESVFGSIVPTSTLQTYLDADVIYYRCKPAT